MDFDTITAFRDVLWKETYDYINEGYTFKSHTAKGIVIPSRVFYPCCHERSHEPFFHFFQQFFPEITVPDEFGEKEIDAICQYSSLLEKEINAREVKGFYIQIRFLLAAPFFMWIAHQDYVIDVAKNLQDEVNATGIDLKTLSLYRLDDFLTIDSLRKELIVSIYSAAKRLACEDLSKFPQPIRVPLFPLMNILSGMRSHDAFYWYWRFIVPFFKRLPTESHLFPDLVAPEEQWNHISKILLKKQLKVLAKVCVEPFATYLIDQKIGFIAYDVKSVLMINIYVDRYTLEKPLAVKRNVAMNERTKFDNNCLACLESLRSKEK